MRYCPRQAAGGLYLLVYGSVVLTDVDAVNADVLDGFQVRLHLLYVSCAARGMQRKAVGGRERERERARESERERA